MFIACVLLPIGMPIITLTTDFGTRDGYVGAMKGVIGRRAPEATVVDIAHATWVVATNANKNPFGTVHVGVVDPGVGSARRAVIASQTGQWYVGPDNGVFGYVPERATAARSIDMHQVGRSISRTFHGRDVFAPVPASLRGR